MEDGLYKEGGDGFNNCRSWRIHEYLQNQPGPSLIYIPLTEQSKSSTPLTIGLPTRRSRRQAGDQSKIDHSENFHKVETEFNSFLFPKVCFLQDCEEDGSLNLSLQRLVGA
jgi:hypothetical protein